MEPWQIAAVLTGLALNLCALGALWAHMDRAIDSVQVQQWALDSLDDNVQYLANKLTTWHAKPAATAEERAERDADVADIQLRLNSPGPGLMQWDRTRDVRARYEDKPTQPERR